jgi:RimJ/RimL family protein N-acetyltransferase
MPNRKPVELRTERLLLRPLRLTDADDVYAYASDAEWSANIPQVPYPYERRHAEEFVARIVPSDWEPSFALEFEGRVIGTVEVHINALNLVAELGYSVARAHWGKGFATEAARAVIGYLFEHLEVAQVVAVTAAPNEGSWRVMEKLGMRREGYFRGHRHHRGGVRVDEVRYGLPREDWRG